MIFLIPVAVLSFALNGAMTRAFQLKFPGCSRMLRYYQALFCLVSAIAFAAGGFISGGELKINLQSLLFGAGFGIFYFIAVMCSSRGYEKGSMSLTAIIVNMSLIIPLFYSCILLKETPTLIQIAGILLMLVTLVLSSLKDKRGEKTKASGAWIYIVLLAFFANGISAVVQKSFVRANGDGGTMFFMCIAYLISSVLFVLGARLEKKTDESIEMKKRLHTLPMALISGVGSFGGNALLGFLCTKVDGAVLYPCINGGLCIVSAALSFLLFKEKPTLRKYIAIAIGVVAIVLLNL